MDTGSREVPVSAMLTPWCDPPYKDVAVMSTLGARGWWLGHP